MAICSAAVSDFPHSLGLEPTRVALPVVSHEAPPVAPPPRPPIELRVVASGVVTGPDKRYQVFLSSTYVDLIAERAAVIQALLELDCIPAGMELFPAADEDQWSLIKEVIDSCDYYVVILGGRYGSMSVEGISYTEQEYDYAIASGIPVLGFVHASPTDIPIGKSDIEPPVREKLDAFRAKVMSRMVKQYSSPDELASVVTRGLVRAMRQYPRPGWVRGDQAMSDDVRVEIAELRAALAEAERSRRRAPRETPLMAWITTSRTVKRRFRSTSTCEMCMARFSKTSR